MTRIESSRFVTKVVPYAVISKLKNSNAKIYGVGDLEFPRELASSSSLLCFFGEEVFW